MKKQKPLGIRDRHQTQMNSLCERPGGFFQPESWIYPLSSMDVLASRFQMDFTVREHPGRISCLWKRNVPVSTRILQCLVSDKTFPNPLIYQMANPVNSLRNIITCNLFCYSFSACTSLSLAASQEPGRSCSLSTAIPSAVGITVLPEALSPCLEQQDSGEGGGTSWVQLCGH